MNDNEQKSEKRETLADILAEIRDALRNENPWGENDTRTAWINSGSILAYLDRLDAAWKRERKRDERLLFRLLWFDVEDYQYDWACNAYRQTVKDCCARLGVQYHESGKEIAEEMDESKLGVEVAKEVCDE